MPLTSDELLLRWRKRCREILSKLPPELLAEYRKLQRLIKGVCYEESIEDGERWRQIGRKEGEEIIRRSRKRLFDPTPTRIPLSVHKENLICYFIAIKNCRASRSEIVQRAHIPLGSLSELLAQKEFVQETRGFWRLSEKGVQVAEALSKGASFDHRVPRQMLKQKTEGESGG
jgi:hypothetical protein